MASFLEILARVAFILKMTLACAVFAVDIYFSRYTHKHLEPYFTIAGMPIDAHKAHVCFVSVVILSVFSGLGLVAIPISYLKQGSQKRDGSYCAGLCSILISMMLVALALFAAIYPIVHASVWKDFFANNHMESEARHCTAMFAFLIVSLFIGFVIGVCTLFVTLAYGCVQVYCKRKAEKDLENGDELTTVKSINETLAESSKATNEITPAESRTTFEPMKPGPVKQ